MVGSVVDGRLNFDLSVCVVSMNERVKADFRYSSHVAVAYWEQPQESDCSEMRDI